MKKGAGSLLDSFRYAFRGLRYAVRTQRNMRIHISMAALVSLFGLFYQLAPVEWIALYMTITFVIVCELLNTAVENCVDTATEEYSKYAEIAKDVAAGAVVVAALLAVVVAAFLFLDPARLGPAFGRLLSSPVCTVGVCVLTFLLLWWISRAKRGEIRRKEEDKE
ncbi:MAG TPA: diacylglycerol kinase family protein [Candidatus Aphodoplasma excrementigallinarum]|uniref:Diacylglycerol kinase family protein n=1 Tax=Candidatus Aphodoplasma excrementigallinarum TaxID=2840673 RepID=A0A9D1SZY7_9FIRM|nr:diacylglycerol kinase family protein [Candidatus Aphodoplasma excrementigallinarum]